MNEELTEKPKKSHARMYTSAVYVVVWIALCALKWTVPGNYGAFGFDALFCAISVIGSIEFLNAMGGVSVPQRAVTIAFAAVIVPLYVAVQMTMKAGLLAIACAFFVYVMFLMATSVFDHSRSTVKGTITCVFCMLYCGVLSSFMSAINHLASNSMVAILMLFMCTVLTDTGAFTFGSLLKRFFPAKLAPQLSPNKTVVGAIGGLIGGVVGAILAYYTMYICGGINGQVFFFHMNGVQLTFTSDVVHPLVGFVILGFIAGIFSQIGDLFESAIKRECGIKDMGKCLPGHGGVLDRFDSMLYSSVIVLLSFGIIIS